MALLVSVSLGALYFGVRLVGQELGRLSQIRSDGRKLKDLVEHELAMQELESKLNRLLSKSGNGDGTSE
ncbi:MAG TPA: hypothetical protein VIM84_03730 [Gemmatimonadales bacterium]